MPAPDIITTGIDVSLVQRVTSWKEVRNAGHRFLVAKATEGERYVDPSMRKHIDGANSVGMLTGVYSFALPDEDARDDVDGLFESIKPLEASQALDLPCTLDLESRNTRPAATILHWARIWCELYQERDRLGRLPILYTGFGFWEGLVKDEPKMALDPFWQTMHLWVAHYTSAAKPLVPRPWKQWGEVGGPRIWQWAASAPGGPIGMCPGIVGMVDLDRFAGPYDDLRRMAGLDVALPTLPG